MSKETVTLSEMTREELETFLEFLYKGSLPDAKLVQHHRSLYLSAHKYEIPYLQDLCRKELISTIDVSNVFHKLDLAKKYSDKILEAAVSWFIESHVVEVAFSSKFESFVESYPALAVETFRVHMMVRRLSKILDDNGLRKESISSSISNAVLKHSESDKRCIGGNGNINM
ncbi:unnamed protein product [Microthlaspi erraticum]|uniref:BTB domain-containing protein n=1 Tax=Microthlaspi erraticum TaxID=1685480 RepID=A0A6D2HGL7_9BRAS|nr:unnamed protein product [Microthlaspi erraticum]